MNQPGDLLHRRQADGPMEQLGELDRAGLTMIEQHLPSRNGSEFSIYGKQNHLPSEVENSQIMELSTLRSRKFAYCSDYLPLRLLALLFHAL